MPHQAPVGRPCGSAVSRRLRLAGAGERQRDAERRAPARRGVRRRRSPRGPPPSPPRSTGPARCRRWRGRATGRRGRSARTPARRGRAPGRGRGRPPPPRRGRPRRATRTVDRRARRRVDARVGEQVAHDLAQARRRRPRTTTGPSALERRSAGRGPRPGRRRRGRAARARQVDRLALAAGGPGRAAPAAGGRRPARPSAAASASIRRMAASRSSGSRGGAAAEQLGVAAHRGERGLQLVGGVGDEPAQPRPRTPAARRTPPRCWREHRVERPRRGGPTSVRGVVVVDAPSERSPAAMALGGAADALERPQPQSHEPPRQHGQRSEHRRRPRPARSSSEPVEGRVDVGRAGTADDQLSPPAPRGARPRRAGQAAVATDSDAVGARRRRRRRRRGRRGRRAGSCSVAPEAPDLGALDAPRPSGARSWANGVGRQAARDPAAAAEEVV